MGPPQDLYDHPASPFVTEFLGDVNVLSTALVNAMSPTKEAGFFPIGAAAPGSMTVYIRPHDLELSRTRNGRPTWQAKIARIIPLGAITRVELQMQDGTKLQVELPREKARGLDLQQNEEVYVAPRDIRVFHGTQISESQTGYAI
jgi:sulfate transport system ATP-binding protein